MDWDLAIKRNSEALKGIVAALFTMLGLGGSHGFADSQAPPQRRAARSPARRIRRAAPDHHCGPRPRGEGGAIASDAQRAVTGKGGAPRSSFQLFDTRKDFPELRQHRVKYAKHPPRILFFGDDSRVDSLWPAPPPAAAPVTPPDGLVDAERLSRRLQALKLALEDLPRQARRLARWRVRREAAKAPKFKSPLRPGPPPGHRKRPIHPIDEILADCHWLAWDAMKPDSS